MKQANEIYDFISLLAARAHGKGVYFWIKNPKRSWMWEIQGFRNLVALDDVQVHDLQLCMFGLPEHSRVPISPPQELMILLDLPGCSGRLLELRERQGDLDQQPPEANIGIFEEKMKFAGKKPAR